jgi:hypothetical protein
MLRVVLGEAAGTIESVRDNVAEVRFDTGARCPVPLAWLSPAPGCAECGGPMEAQRSTRKYCSATCRKRAQRCHANSGGSQGMEVATNARQAGQSDVKPGVLAA